MLMKSSIDCQNLMKKGKKDEIQKLHLTKTFFKENTYLLRVEKICQNEMNHENQGIVSLTDQSTVVSTAFSQNALAATETQESTSSKQNELSVFPEIFKPCLMNSYPRKL